MRKYFFTASHPYNLNNWVSTTTKRNNLLLVEKLSDNETQVVVEHFEKAKN